MYCDIILLQEYIDSVEDLGTSVDGQKTSLNSASDKFELDATSKPEGYIDDSDPLKNLGTKAQNYNVKLSNRVVYLKHEHKSINSVQDGLDNIIAAFVKTDTDVCMLFEKASAKLLAIDPVALAERMEKTNNISTVQSRDDVKSADTSNFDDKTEADSTKTDTVNNTDYYRTAGQYNGSQYNYHFTKEFNQELENIANDVVDSVIPSANLTEEDKAYLKKLLPYVIKGVGASESGWNDGSEGYVGLTEADMAGTQWFSATFGDQTYDTNISHYNTPAKGARMAATMFVHWANYYKGKNPEAGINQAIWSGWGGAGTCSYTGAPSCAAYQLCMADAFYKQDHPGESLFTGCLSYVTKHPEEYGVAHGEPGPRTDVTI